MLLTFQLTDKTLVENHPFTQVPYHRLIFRLYRTDVSKATIGGIYHFTAVNMPHSDTEKETEDF
jgi:hypothetical protein